MARYPQNSDFSTYRSPDGLPDLDPNWTTIGGARAVLEHVARRITTPPGSYDDSAWGFDLNSYFNASLLDGEFDALAAAIRNEAVQEEGVEDCAVDTKLDSSGKLSVIVTLSLVDQDKLFDLVFVLSSETILLVYFPV